MAGRGVGSKTREVLQSEHATAAGAIEFTPAATARTGTGVKMCQLEGFDHLLRWRRLSCQTREIGAPQRPLDEIWQALHVRNRKGSTGINFVILYSRFVRFLRRRR
jgi:hypothetical protein